MSRTIILVIGTVLFGGCMLFPPAPDRFPQFDETTIEGPGSYNMPQWSADNRYLAFIDRSGNTSLIVYDSTNGNKWTVSNNIDLYYRWGPGNTLVYTRYRPDLSGSPFPSISDLYQVELDGSNNKRIASNLSNIIGFAWFNDGNRLAILLTSIDSREDNHDVYILNVATGTLDLFLEAQTLGFSGVESLSLSQDENLMLLYSTSNVDQKYNGGEIVIYSLATQNVIDRIIASELIPSGDVTNYDPSILDWMKSGWIDGQRWLLSVINTPGGECYNYALFFFDISNWQNSFCIPTVSGIVAEPDISPDMKKITYITVVGPGTSYIVISELPSTILDKLETSQ